MSTEVIYDLEKLADAAKFVLATHQTRLITFRAPMGAGKTTLIKEICRLLGVTSNMSSPTYGLVNEYTITGGLVYHFDFYRIQHIEEVFDIGYETYFDSGHVCLIEWPERIEELLNAEPHDTYTIGIRSDGTRSIKFG